MSDLRSVLLLCWRDTGHPQGGGSETYLQRIGAQLAAAGIAVTLRTARYPGAPRREVVDGVRISRAGGHYSVYVWALLAMAAARVGLGPLRGVRPDVVVDAQNGLPFCARLVYGRRVVVLVHHCHREQWPVAGPAAGPVGLVCRVVVVAAAAPAQPVPDRVAAVGSGSGRSGRGQRADRGGAQRSRRGAGAVAGRSALGHASGGGALPAGAAQADRGRATDRRRAATPDPRAAPGHRRRRMVATATRRACRTSSASPMR